MFTTTTTKTNLHDSDSDEDSIERAVQQHSSQKAAGGIQNLVNQQIGNSYRVSQPPSFPNAQSPLSEDSSWTTSSVGGNKQSNTKGVHSLVLQQPTLLTNKSSEHTWDDSRPLSADLKRSSHLSNSSDESDEDEEKKSSTIVRSPFMNSAVSNLVQKNIQPVESKTTGVENLTKIFGCNYAFISTCTETVMTQKYSLDGEMFFFSSVLLDQSHRAQSANLLFLH